jgi:hypothetical protein
VLFRSLEDKYYSDLYPGMVETYFRETIHTFEPEEMDMSIKTLNALTDMFGLKPVKSLLVDCDLVLKIEEKGNILASLVFEVRNSRIDRGYAVQGLTKKLYPAIDIALPLSLVKKGLTSDHPVMSTAVLLAMIGKNVFTVLRDAARILIAKKRDEKQDHMNTIKTREI